VPVLAARPMAQPPALVDPQPAETEFSLAHPAAAAAQRAGHAALAVRGSASAGRSPMHSPHTPIWAAMSGDVRPQISHVAVVSMPSSYMAWSVDAGNRVSAVGYWPPGPDPRRPAWSARHLAVDDP
jgi:hypothetical protein